MRMANINAVLTGQQRLWTVEGGTAEGGHSSSRRETEGRFRHQERGMRIKLSQAPPIFTSLGVCRVVCIKTCVYRLVRICC